MYGLNISHNIAKLRRERKMTQEELADFLGVTKASVSKWENQQSTPDIMLLPLMASFFDVTVDELLGYEPQLSKEQIRKVYTELTENFTKMPFSEAMNQVEKWVQRYYSCYPFLLQICVLYLNHFMLAEKEEEGRATLEKAVKLCSRIEEKCSNVSICSDAIALKALCFLYQGKAKEVIEMLEPITGPEQMSEQNDTLLIQAYQAAGQEEKAKSFAQIRQYHYLLSLIGNAVHYLALYSKEEERCEEAIKRIQRIMKIYHVNELHPNSAAQFYYQAALVYAENGQKEKALKMLEDFSRCVLELLKEKRRLLHGDDYFDQLDEWLENLPLGAQAPRDKTFIRQSTVMAFEHPAFACIKDTQQFQKIRNRIQDGKEQKRC